MPSYAIDSADSTLHLASRRNWPACTKPCSRKVNEGFPCTCVGGLHVLSRAPSPAEALEVIEKDRPDVCTLHCWRHGGTTTCICGEEEGDEGTTEGGW